MASIPPLSARRGAAVGLPGQRGRYMEVNLMSVEELVRKTALSRGLAFGWMDSEDFLLPLGAKKKAKEEDDDEDAAEG